MARKTSNLRQPWPLQFTNVKSIRESVLGKQRVKLVVFFFLFQAIWKWTYFFFSSFSFDKNNIIIQYTLTTTVFIRTISAVFFTVTEKSTFDTITVSTSQRTIWTQWFIGVQKRLYFALFVLKFAVFHSIFPVTSLLFNVKVKTSWTTNGLKTLFWWKFNEKRNTLFFF